MKLGVIGYSQQKFDERKARSLVTKCFGELGVDENTTIISGLTDLGIPGVAYEIADRLGLRTVGIAPLKALEYDLYDVDETIVIGEEFGDESDYFINYIDALARIGGGNQSQLEYEKFSLIHPDKKRVFKSL